MRSTTVGLYVAMFLLVSSITGELHAYLDFGTGSMIVQVLFGGIAGAAMIVKLYWRQLKNLVLRRHEDDSPEG